MGWLVQGEDADIFFIGAMLNFKEKPKLKAFEVGVYLERFKDNKC
jgi:hypothetical protein